MADDTALALEQYSCHARLGNFHEAETIWKEKLSSEPSQFDVIIARVDCLLKQSRYGDVCGLTESAIDNATAKLTPEQNYVLRMFWSYCNIFTHGALRYAIEQAKMIFERLHQSHTEEMGDLEVIAVEVWLRIMVFARASSNYVNDIVLDYPLTSSTASGEWVMLEEYCERLRRQARFWDLLTIIKILAPIQPRSWVKNAYEDCLKALSTAEETIYSLSCLTATHLAFARYLVDRDSEAEVRHHHDEASSMIQKAQTLSESYVGSRQYLELQFLKIEWETAHSNVGDHIKWTKLSLQCRDAHEYGLESDCLGHCIDSALADKNHAELRRLQPWIERIHAEFTQDTPALLHHMCNQWLPQSQEPLGDLLARFEDFRTRYPLSHLFSGQVDDIARPTDWDLPHERERMERIRYHYYIRLGDRPTAAGALRLASAITPYSNWSVALQRDLGSARPWIFEWLDRNTGAPASAIDVLTDRLRLGPQPGTDSAPFDRAVRSILNFEGGSSEGIARLTATLTADQVAGNMLEYSRRKKSGKSLDDVLAAAENWFGSSSTFSQSASTVLLVSLRLQYTLSVRSFHPPPPNDVIIDLNKKFYEHVSRLTNPSIVEYFKRPAMQARTMVADSHLILTWPHCPVPLLQWLKAEYGIILDFYRTTDLSENYSRIATLLARLGEVTLLLREDEGYLRQFSQYHDQADQLFNGMRESLRKFGPAKSLRLRTSFKGAIAGHQVVLHRAVSVLVFEYRRLAEQGLPLEATAHILWDFVQRGKNRALLDHLSPLKLHKKPAPTPAADVEPKSDDDADDDEDVTSDVGEAGHPPVLSAPEPHVRLDLAGITLSRIEKQRTEEQSGSAESRSVDTWDRSMDRLSQLCSRPGNAGAEATSAPSRAPPDSSTETSKHLEGRTITSKELAAAFANHPRRIVFVDWFVAITPEEFNGVHLLLLRASEPLRAPVAMKLQKGIGKIVEKWAERSSHLKPSFTREEAYEDLQELQPLIAPLARLTEPDDILVFCPTSMWSIDRVPLHALESSSRSLETEGADRTPLALRNPIVYTYSHSSLYGAMRARQQHPDHRLRRWKATMMSPLSKLPANPPLPLIGPLSKIRTREVARAAREFASCVEADLLDFNRVTTPAVVNAINDADFICFLGHVHPESGEATNPLAQHLLLYHPQANPPCLPNARHEPGTFLSAEAILANCKTRDGAHSMLIACGSGEAQYDSVDEPLGLVSAFLHCGASSVVSTAWKIPPLHAAEWTTAYGAAWEEERRRTEQAGEDDSFDLLRCFQRAVRHMIKSEGKKALLSWAGFVHSGYWLMSNVCGTCEEKVAVDR